MNNVKSPLLSLLLVMSLFTIVDGTFPFGARLAAAQTYRGTLDDHDEPGSKPFLRKKATIRYIKSGGQYFASVNNSPYFQVPISNTKYGTSPAFRGEKGCTQIYYLLTQRPGPSKIWVHVATSLQCGSKEYAWGVWGWVRR